MPRATRIGIALWILAAGALVVSLLVPEDERRAGSPTSRCRRRRSGRATAAAIPRSTPTLWLGISIGLAAAGLLVVAYGRRRS